MALPGDVETQLEEVYQWDGAPLPAALRAPEARMAEGPGSHGAAREPGGRAPRDWGQECVALGDGIFGHGGKGPLEPCRTTYPLNMQLNPESVGDHLGLVHIPREVGGITSEVSEDGEA
jgi:hypothetical protein